MQDDASPFIIPPGTFRIRQADHAAALQALQRGCPKHMVIADYLQHPEEFARTRYLARAFELLGMQCDVDGGDLLLVPFEGGESVDLSAYYWDFIEDLAHEEKPGSMAPGTRLALADLGIDAEGEDDGDNGRHHSSEAVDDFIGGMRDEKITLAALDALIASEGGVDCRDYNGDTPLLATCTRYRWALAQHADAQMKEEEGDDEDEDSREAKASAAAELAVQAHNLQTVLQRQPDLAARNRDGSDALGLAAESGSVEFVDLLLAHGATVNAGALQGAVRSLSVDMVRKLAPHHPRLLGSDLLVHACAAHSAMPTKLGMVRYLVQDLGCDVNARAAGGIDEMLGSVRRMATPLMAAALTDDLAVAQYLLAAGADVHAVDVYGNTALHYCSGQTWVSDGGPLWFALDDNPKVIALLRQLGADNGATNVAGRTPDDLLASRRG